MGAFSLIVVINLLNRWEYVLMRYRDSKLFALVAKLIDSLPGEKLGNYKPVPYFFFIGGGIEWFMINVHINGINFYEVIKRKNLEYYHKEKARQRLLSELETKLEQKRKSTTK